MVNGTAAFVNLCASAIAAADGAIQAWSASALTTYERELLRTASVTGRFEIVRLDELGVIVSIGERAFAKDDPEVTVQYCEAFKRLCHRGLVDHIGGASFTLSKCGQNLARNLKTSE